MVVLGELAQSSRKIREFAFGSSTDFQLLFTTYDIDQVIYFSHSLNALSTLDREIDQLRMLLDSFRAAQSLDFLYVTGPDSNFGQDGSRRIILDGAEELCHYYAEAYSFSFKMVRSLYLYNLQDPTDSLGQLLLGQQSDSGLRVHPEQLAYYLYPKDLLILCYRILDNWSGGFECLSVADSFQISYSQLFDELKLPSDSFFSEALPLSKLTVLDDSLRKDYGWFPKISLLDDLGDARYQAREGEADSLWQKTQRFLQAHKGLVSLLQFMLFFALSEILSYSLGQQVYFKTIDYRLFFVMAAGFIFGLKMGMAAALLATVGLVTQNIISGSSNLSTLFFEPSNWIPYMVYFISAMVSSYAKEKDQLSLASLESEKTDLQQQLEAEGGFIEDMLAEKAELTQQILGRQDSYGKIYRFLQHLDTPYLDIFMLHLLAYLSEVFETETISLYSLKQGQLDELQFSLQTSSAQLLELESQADLVTYLKEEGIWVNQHLRADYPMYLAGLEDQDELRYCIAIQSVAAEKLNLYHQNLFKVLMGLANHSYQRLQSGNRRLHSGSRPVLKDQDFYQKMLAVKDLDLHYFNAQVLQLSAPGLSPGVLAQCLAPKLTMFDSLGLVDGVFYLIYNAPTASALADWRDYLSGYGVEIIAVQNLEETIETIHLP